MRTHAAPFALSILLALGLSGCGEGRLIVNVDVLSFLPEADRELDYGPIPAGLSGAVTSEIFGVSTPEGIGGETIVDSVVVTAAADLVNLTGSASLEFEIFFDPDSATLYAGTPAIAVSATVSPGQTTQLTLSEPVPAAFLGVFNESRFFTGVRVRFQSLDSPPLTGPAVEGTARVTAFEARVVASEDVF